MNFFWDEVTIILGHNRFTKAPQKPSGTNLSELWYGTGVVSGQLACSHVALGSSSSLFLTVDLI